MSGKMELHIDWVTGLIAVVILALLALMALEPHSITMVPPAPVELKSIEANMVDSRIEASGTTMSGEAATIEDVVEISVKTKFGGRYFIHLSGR